MTFKNTKKKHRNFDNWKGKKPCWFQVSINYIMINKAFNVEETKIKNKKKL